MVIKKKKANYSFHFLSQFHFSLSPIVIHQHLSLPVIRKNVRPYPNNASTGCFFLVLSIPPMRIDCFVFRSKKVRNEFDDNDFSKDDENSLSQSIFDDPTSSRTRTFIVIFFLSLMIFCYFLALTGQKITDSQLPRGAILTDLNDETEENLDDQQIQSDTYQIKKFLEPDACEQTHHIIIPSYSAWFDYNAINAIEKRALIEFFNGKNRSKTPEM